MEEDSDEDDDDESSDHLLLSIEDVKVIVAVISNGSAYCACHCLEGKVYLWFFSNHAILIQT